jgi:DNA-binding MarR family transcriptional regulator
MTPSATERELGRNRSTINADRPALPGELGSTRTKLVYLYLWTVEEATIEQLRETLNIKTIELYPILDELMRKGLVTRDEDRYRC